MTVRIDLKQTSTVEEGPVYRVVNEVTYAEGIPREIFVMDVTTDLFSHVATVWDLQVYPNTKDLALLDGVGYYRVSSCVKDFEDLQTGTTFKTYTKSRVEWLVSTYDDANNVFEGVDSYTIEG